MSKHIQTVRTAQVHLVTEGHSEVAGALDALLTEVAKLTEERDGLAAKIGNALKIGKFALGKSLMRTIDAMILALRADPVATLAARDAKKWAEGHKRGFNHSHPRDFINPYRTLEKENTRGSE